MKINIFTRTRNENGNPNPCLARRRQVFARERQTSIEVDERKGAAVGNAKTSGRGFIFMRRETLARTNLRHARTKRRSRLCTCHVLSPPYLSRNDKFASHCPVRGIACFSANRSKGSEWRCWPIVRSGWLIVLSAAENFTEGKRDSPTTDLHHAPAAETLNRIPEAVTHHLSQLSVRNV